MRRRILINALSLAQGGGARSYLVNVVRELERDSRGFDFTVLSDSRALTALSNGAVAIETVRLPATSRAVRVPLRVAFEEAVLPRRALRFDLLYCPADLAPAVAGTPTVVALRNMHIYDRRFYDTLRLRTLERLVRAGVRRARKLVFPSRAAADLIARRIPIPADKVAIVPHGVSQDSFVARAEEAVGAADRPPYLFFPASIERHKRMEVLIESLRHSNDPRLEAWIAGSEALDPTYVAELHALVRRLGLAERVRFLGPVPYREILNYYRGALALAFPSNLETFGHPMLEAMLAETPIVAADIPSVREIATDIALYFAPDDPVGLARAVDALRRDPAAAAARVARGRLRAAEFSWARSVDRLCEVFGDALAYPKRASG